MKGYLYKELKQYQKIFYIIVMAVMYAVFGSILYTMAMAGNITREAILVYATNGMGLRLMLLLLGFVLSMSAVQYTCQGDDTKIWGYFVASNPKGIRGYIYTKYGLIFAMSAGYFVLTAGLDFCLTRMVSVIASGEIPVMGEVMAIMLMIQLIYYSITIPFAVRFGAKIGNTIQLILVLMIVIAGILMAAIHPVETFEWIDGVMNSGKLTVSLKWWLPIVTIVSYILSCLLSVRLYRKGVVQYYR